MFKFSKKICKFLESYLMIQIMKRSSTFIPLIIFVCVVSPKIIFAQTDRITPDIAKKIQFRVDSAALVFKKKISQRDGDSPEYLQFALDTFKIECASEYAMDYDYSTVGMNAIMDKATDEYDKLLNKYYKKLLAHLQGDDKQTLINTQRAWLKFKQLEINLIGTVSQTKYSGGGSIQSNLNTEAINEMVKQRAVALYGFYSRLQNN